jgi:preprotein translocase SecE subunit
MLLQRQLAEGNFTLGAAITLAVGAALAIGTAFAYTRPNFERWLLQVEAQGWFTAAPYKRSQGQRVRRGTILGILVLAGCGVYTLLHHNTLASASENWIVNIPFTAGRYLILLPDVAITLPLILIAVSLWLAYRIVNVPAFADFLIATEAELNKVSWTTRKRLVQDTIVVLVTVVLLTVFLFVVDQAWAFVLTKVGVIQIAPPSAQQTGDREQPW